MAVTPADVIVIAPDLEGKEALLSETITIAGLQISSDCWGDLEDTATKYLAAHLATISVMGGNKAGAVTSEKVGDLQKSYGAGGSNSMRDRIGLDQTAYGREYARLMKLCGINYLVIT